MEILVQLGGMLLFLTMSLVLLQGKGAILIAGYNTLSAEEKAKYDEAALCRATSRLLLGITFSMALIFIGEFFQQSWLLISGIILMIVIVIGGLIHMNTGHRYRILKK